MDELYAAALDASEESIGIYELDSTVVYVNRATEQLFGVTRERFVGQRMFGHFTEAFGSPFHEAFVRVAGGGAPERFDHYYAPFDRWYANVITRVGDHVHVYARDVTDDVRRRRRLDTLARISEVLTRSELDIHATAEAVAQIMTDVIHAEFTIALLSMDGEWFEVIARTALDGDALAITKDLMRWSAHTGNPAQALRTRQAVLVVGDIQTPSTDPSLVDVVTRYQPTSVLAVPLFVDDRAMGVLIATRRHGHAALTTEDRTLLSEVAPSIALYLSNAARRGEAAALRNRLSAIADALPTLVAFIDRDERYQYVNGAYERWFARPCERFLGHSLRELVGDEAYATIAPHVATVLGGTPVRFRQHVPYAAGPRHVDAHYIPVHGEDGTQIGFASLVYDISTEVRVADIERERAEVERRATRRIESLLALTGRLAGATSPDEIAHALVDGGLDALDSSAATMWQIDASGTHFELVRSRGTRASTAAFAPFPVDAPTPHAETRRTLQPVYVSNRAEYAERFPEFEQLTRELSTTVAFAVLPLVIEGEAHWVLCFVFDDERHLTPDERAYVEILASHGAEALRRARAYAELHDLNELQAAIINSSPGAIVLLDDRGLVQTWSRGAERIFGWKAHEIAGKQIPLIGDQPDFHANLAAVLQRNDHMRIEARRQRASGEWFDLEIYAAPVRLSSGSTMVVALVFDISERKRVERGRELVMEASAHFNRTLDTRDTLQAIVSLPVGRLADWCGVDLIDDTGALARVASSGDDAVPAPSSLVETGAPVLTRDLPDVPRSWVAVPLVFGDRTVGVLTLGARDRNFDELDVSLFSELAGHAATAIENARLYEAARQARSDAEAADRAKDEFLAMLGHELRNPLAPLVTALELMRLRGDTHFERERAVLGRQIDHLSRLVDDLLDVSRITRGKIELHRTRVMLADIVAKAIEQTSPLFEEKRHHLEVDVPDDLVVDGDATRLAQIVANLLSNAAKYTPRDGRISVHATRDRGEVVLAVRDTGIGIAADMLPRVFELFMQAPQSSERPAGGLGLGLAIVRSLVELHGGRVEVASDGRGHGSLFTVRLPAARVEPLAADTSRMPRITRTSAPRRVLVVDDNEDAATLLADLLDAHGHDIRTAFDGPSALRIAGEFHPEVAVLDIGLPVMDGYELAERLRASPELPDLRLIAVTGYGQESDRARSLDAGFQAHLAKPVAIETLVRLVEHR